GYAPAKARQAARIFPPVVARIGPVIEVGRMPPAPDHRIDAAGAAEDLAPGPVDDAPRGAGLRGRAIGPINIRTEIGGPQHRALQRRPTNISTTRLDQQDTAGGIFGQARRQGAAGRTRTDNNVVIGSRNVAPVLTLSDGGRQHLIGQGPGACRPEAECRSQLQESPSIELTGSGAPLDTGQEALVLVIVFVCHSVVPFAS